MSKKPYKNNNANTAQKEAERRKLDAADKVNGEGIYKGLDDSDEDMPEGIRKRFLKALRKYRRQQ